MLIENTHRNYFKHILYGMMDLPVNLNDLPKEIREPFETMGEIQGEIILKFKEETDKWNSET